jgi:hypothetical protein
MGQLWRYSLKCRLGGITASIAQPLSRRIVIELIHLLYSLLFPIFISPNKPHATSQLP